MPLIEPVDDPADPRLADYVGLPDAELRRSIEAPSGSSYGCFIAEGTTVIRRLLASTYRTRSVLVTPPKLRALQDALAGVDAPVYVASPEVLAAVAGFDLHRGAVAAADRAAPLAVADVLAGRRTVALLEGLNDHENLGALARSAIALGVEGLVLDATCADPLYRRSVRVSMGEILFLPYARATDWPRALASVRHAGFQLVALTPSAEATPIDLVEPAPRLAIVLGAEGPGLAATTLAAADVQVRIPIVAGIDSLNVGHAAAIAFHCFARR